jgi:dTDP-4-amino-4,6-dideoxygalactose transaminase
VNFGPAILGGKPEFKEWLPIAKPDISHILNDDFYWGVRRIFKSGMLTNHKHVKEFEKGLREVAQSAYAVATSSCTTGLMLILNALDVKGKDVILPSFTFSATAHAVEWCGANLIFADIDKETFCIDPFDVEKKLTDNTAAIIGVHMFGNPCDVEYLGNISRNYNIPVIYDAAHAIGAGINGFGIGMYGEASAFSFSPTKLITGMEGGAVVTNNPALAAKIRLDREYSQFKDYQCARKGLSARMSEFSAMLLNKQLETLPEIIINRIDLATLFRNAGLIEVEYQKIPEGAISVYKDLAILIKDDFGLTRDELMKALEAENIATKKYFSPAIHELEPYKHYKTCELPNTEYVTERILTLPLHNNMTDATMTKIWGAIVSIFCQTQEIKEKLNA